MNINVGRCGDCSFNADTGKYGSLLRVGGCNCVDPSPEIDPVSGESIPLNCRCDVDISNRNVKYECKQVSSISDCVDRLTYCSGAVSIPDQYSNLLLSFCNSPGAPEESWNKYGTGYIDDGQIIWNIQFQASPCGSARTAIFNSEGGVFASDQAPNCLPYSNTFIGSGSVGSDKCPNGKDLMVKDLMVKDYTSDYNENTECCVSDSYCSGSVFGCEVSPGVKYCSQYPDMKSCDNPCYTSIEVNNSGSQWKLDVCEFLCPGIERQNYWFEGTDRICSEEYYNLCKIAGCDVDEDCNIKWGGQVNMSKKLWPLIHPTVV